MTRDPRMAPITDDVVTKAGLIRYVLARELYRQTVSFVEVRATDAEVRHNAQTGKVVKVKRGAKSWAHKTSLKAWRHWCVGAEVVHARP
jgi:Holliday junction resolvase-like predicted endonuclease